MEEYVTITLREWRQERGLSQQQLADLMHATQRAVSAVEATPLSSLTLSTVARRAPALRSYLWVCALRGEQFWVLDDYDNTDPLAGTLRQVRLLAGYATQQALFETGAFGHFSRIAQIETTPLLRQRVKTLQEFLAFMGAEMFIVVVLPGGCVKVLR